MRENVSLHRDERDEIEEKLNKIEKRILFNYRFSLLCTMGILSFMGTVVVVGNHTSAAALTEWLNVFLYMTLTMLIMSVIPCYDQIHMLSWNSAESQSPSSSSSSFSPQGNINLKII